MTRYSGHVTLKYTALVYWLFWAVGVTEPNLVLLTPHTAMPIYWCWAVVKESTVFIARHSARERGESFRSTPTWSLSFFLSFFFFNQRRSTKAGISHCLWLIVIWESGCLEFSGQVAHGSGVCELFLSWRNNLSVYFHEEIYTNSFSTLTMLLARAILATWLWLISVQLVHDCRWHHWQRICLPMQET